nr:carbonic anhydrase [uncultured bacterium]
MNPVPKSTRWPGQHFLLLGLIAGALVIAHADNPKPIEDSIKRLVAGNERYVAGTATHSNQSAARRTEVAQSQAPFATILGCADSRVSPEVVFDQGLGDLFVIRVAGNVVEDSGLGSIEYAVAHLHTPLLVVLGHERCGVMKAALEGGAASGHVQTLVTAVSSAVTSTKGQPGDALDNAVRANVQRVVKQLQAAGPILNEAVKSGKLKIVGARYDLDTGVVEFLP